MPDRVETHYTGFVRQYFERIHTYLANLAHSGQKGTVSERAVAELLRDFLPTRFAVEHDAVLVDTKGTLSRQTDLAIWNPHRFPKMFPMRGATILPVDVCAGVIEVKANASKDDVLNAFDHATNIKSLRYNRVTMPIPKDFSHLHIGPPGEQIPDGSTSETLPVIHALWCWNTRAESIETVVGWLKEGLDRVSDFQYMPDIAVFLDKGLLWSRIYTVADPSVDGASMDDVIQTMHFPASEDDATARHVKKSASSNEVVPISQGKTVLNFLWTLLPKLLASEMFKDFDPNKYVPDDLHEGRKWSFGGTFHIRR